MKSRGDRERARPSPMTLCETLDPARPAQFCFSCFQLLEPISCTFYLGQCELGSVSLESESTLALPSLFSSGPPLWKRGSLKGFRVCHRSGLIMGHPAGSKVPRTFYSLGATRTSIMAAPHTSSQSPLCGTASFPVHGTRASVPLTGTWL